MYGWLSKLVEHSYHIYEIRGSPHAQASLLAQYAQITADTQQQK